MCDIWTSTDVFLCTSSILNFLVISIDRYCIINHPFKYAPMRKVKLLSFMITGVWVVSALVSLPPILGWGRKYATQIAFSCSKWIDGCRGNDFFGDVFCFRRAVLLRYVSRQVSRWDRFTRVIKFDRVEIDFPQSTIQTTGRIYHPSCDRHIDFETAMVTIQPALRSNAVLSKRWTSTSFANQVISFGRDLASVFRAERTCLSRSDQAVRHEYSIRVPQFNGFAHIDTFRGH